MAETALECGLLHSEWTGRNGICQVTTGGGRKGAPVANSWRLLRASSRPPEPLQVESLVVHAVLVFRDRFAGATDVSPGERGADRGQGDGYPGGPGDGGGEGVAVAEEGVEDGAGCVQGHGPSENSVHRQHPRGDAGF